MTDQFSRTRSLYGAEGVERLAQARVAVFGIGGVGGHAAETLIRSGIGAIHLIDSDEVELTNLNRQLIALHSTIGQAKVDAMAARANDINPACVVTTHRRFFLPETAAEFDFAAYDFIVDAVDTVTAKIALVMSAREAKTPIISAMGAGNKIDPTAIRIADLYETSICRLARIMRKELRKRGVERLPVAYSTEEARSAEGGKEGAAPRPPASCAFVPGAMGLAIASYVVNTLVEGD